MVPVQGALSPRVSEEIIAAVRAYMHDYGVSQADLAKAVGSSSTYVNNLLNVSGAIPADAREKLLRDLNNLLDREARARDNRRPAEFVETPVAEALIHFAELLQEAPSAELGYAFGPSGIGKSICALAIAAERKAIYVMIDDDCATPAGLRHKLLTALRRKRRFGGMLAEIVAALRMPDSVKSRQLLIIDEAHCLKEKTFTMIRKISEQSGCSVLFLGTIDLHRLLNQDDDPEYGQLSSRVAAHLNLTPYLGQQTPGGRPVERLVSVEHIRALFAGNKIKLHPSTQRMLCSLATLMRGHLREVMRLGHRATNIAAKRRAPQVMPAHVEAAAAGLNKKLPLSESDMARQDADDVGEVAAAAG